MKWSASVQGPPDCRAMLGRILGLCRHFLKIEAAALLIPDKDIALVQGEELSRARLEKLLADGQGRTGHGGSRISAWSRSHGADRADRRRTGSVGLERH